jgi:DNA-directed RNA polymerase subunit RPC12/RpoP
LEDHQVSVDLLRRGAVLTIEAPVYAHRVVFYKGIRMEWDEYRNGAPALHIVCPRCSKFGLIAYTNKRFAVDERGRLSVDDPFRCDYCGWRFGVKDGRMFDA